MLAKELDQLIIFIVGGEVISCHLHNQVEDPTDM